MKPKSAHRPLPGAKLAYSIIGVSILVIALAFAGWRIPAVRTVLLQSFTRLPPHYIELYFTSPPSSYDGVVTVPITLVDHGDDSVLQLRFLVEDGSGHVTAQTTTAVSTRRDLPVPVVVQLPEGSDPGLVEVDLVTHPQTLYYRMTARAVAGAAPADPKLREQMVDR